MWGYSHFKSRHLLNTLLKIPQASQALFKTPNDDPLYFLQVRINSVHPWKLTWSVRVPPQTFLNFSGNHWRWPLNKASSDALWQWWWSRSWATCYSNQKYIGSTVVQSTSALYVQLLSLPIEGDRSSSTHFRGLYCTLDSSTWDNAQNILKGVILHDAQVDLTMLLCFMII